MFSLDGLNLSRHSRGSCVSVSTTVFVCCIGTPRCVAASTDWTLVSWIFFGISRNAVLFASKVGECRRMNRIMRRGAGEPRKRTFRGGWRKNGKRNCPPRSHQYQCTNKCKQDGERKAMRPRPRIARGRIKAGGLSRGITGGRQFQDRATGMRKGESEERAGTCYIKEVYLDQPTTLLRY